MSKQIGKYKVGKHESTKLLVDGGSVNGLDLERTLAFAGGWDPAGLTTTAKTDGNVDTGFTIADNTVIDSAWDAAGAAASIVLPAATVGNYVVWRQTAAADGAGDWVMSAVQTLENGITLTVEGTSRIATITGNIEVLNVQDTDFTLYFDIDNFLSAS